MDRIIMWVMACGALIGGADCILGNRMGLGQKFKDGFHLLGPTALSMAGILCLVPLLARLLSAAAEIICTPFGIDPGILGGFLAIDMGGYQLALEMAHNPVIGSFSGICISAILGCTITFTIPVGMGMLDKDAQSDFSRGILYGIASMPAAFLVGGLMCGLGMGEVLKQCLLLFVFSFLVLLGIWKKTSVTIRGFSIVARCISMLTTLGIALGAFEYMTGFSILPGLSPLPEAMKVVSSIGIVALGSLPVSDILQRLLRRPLDWFGARTGMNNASVTGLLIGMVSVLPAIALVRDMDRRGRIVNAAFMVCTASALTAHLGFTASVDTSLLGALLVSKFTGGIFGLMIALQATRKMHY